MTCYCFTIHRKSFFPILLIIVPTICVSAIFSLHSIGSVQAELRYPFDANCVGTECIKLKIELMYESCEHAHYLDCLTILACLEIQEQINEMCWRIFSNNS